MAHGWTPDVHEVVIGTVVTIVGGGVITLWRNHLTHTKTKVAELAVDLKEHLADSKEAHKEFYKRLGEIDTAIGIIKAKLEID